MLIDTNSGKIELDALSMHFLFWFNLNWPKVSMLFCLHFSWQLPLMILFSETECNPSSQDHTILCSDRGNCSSAFAAHMTIQSYNIYNHFSTEFRNIKV